jgi:DNA repair exonuclease SbcCD nuclease subunit
MGSVKRLDTLRLAPSPAEVAEGGRPVSIYGLHAFDKDEWTVPESSDFKILVAHKMITNIVIPGMHCFTLEDVARKTNADVVLSGDIHKPHHETVNGKLMVNPGSLARLSIDDRDREPQVAIITLDADGASCDMRTLPGRPVETLFDLKAYSEKMASRIHKEDFTRTFVQAIVSIKAESTKMDDVLISFLEKNGVGEKMKSLVREYWGRAERDALEEVKE